MYSSDRYLTRDGTLSLAFLWQATTEDDIGMSWRSAFCRRETALYFTFV